MKWSLIIVLLLSSMVLHVRQGEAIIDDLELGLHASYPAALRWFNIEGRPEWIEGQKPQYRRDLGMHVVGLAPGSSVTVWLPRSEMLRIRGAEGLLVPGDLEVFLSNGSGLYASANVLVSEDGRDLVVRPESPDPLIVRISRPGHLEGQLQLALFFSNQEALEAIAPYRRLMNLEDPPVRIRGDGASMDWGELFWRLEPGKKLKAEIPGPARLSLETYFDYSAEDSGRFQTYELYVGLDGEINSVFNFETRPELYSTSRDGNKPLMLGRMESGYIEVSEGRHMISLETTAPLYARVLLQEEPDYLFKALNQPVPSTRELREEFKVRHAKAPSLRVSEQVLNFNKLMGMEVSSVEGSAMSLARNNAYREGGLAAAGLMRSLAERHRYYPEVSRAATDMLSHTFFRPLLPSEVERGARLEYSRFVWRELKEPDENILGTIVYEQHGDEILGIIPEGFFTDIPASEARAYKYLLPERASDSTLRIVVEAGSQACYGGLMVQLENQRPLRLIIAKEADLEADRVRTSLAETGISVLKYRHRGPGSATLSGPFSMRNNPSRLGKVHTYETELPSEVRQIRVWRDGSCDTPLKTSLHYRTSKPFVPSEQAYLSALSRADDRKMLAGLFARAIINGGEGEIDPTSSPDTRDSAAKEIINGLQAFRRLIISLDLSYKASYEDKPLQPVLRSYGQEYKVHALDEAKALEKRGNNLAALQAWTEIAPLLTGEERTEAEFSRIRLLKMLGEEYLSERLLRGLLFFGETERARQEAFAELERIYRKGMDTESLLSLYASALRKKPSAQLIAGMTEILAGDGEYEMALIAGLLLAEEEQPAGALALASYRLGWWRVFDRTVSRIADRGLQAVWRGLRHSGLGEYDLTLKEFRAGGGLGMQMTAAFEEGLIIRDRLSYAAREEKLTALGEWSAWQEKFPGPFNWREEPSLVSGYAKSAMLYSTPRDVYSQWFIAGRDQAVRLEVAGPVRLRLEARPLHDRGNRLPVDGWIRVTDGDRLYPFPVNNNMPQENLVVAGDTDQVPGRKTVADISLGPGLHSLEVSAEGMETLLRVFASRPEMALPVLPVITPDTVFSMLDSGGQEDAFTYHDVTLFSRRDEAIFIVPEKGDAMVEARRQGAPGSFQLPEKQFDSRTLSVTALLKELARTGNRDRKEDMVSRLLFLGDTEGALALTSGDTEKDVLLRETILLWMAEHDQGKRLLAVSISGQNISQYPDLEGLSPISRRLRLGTGWLRVDSLEESAGLRYVESTGADPESPLLKVRRTLMEGLEEGSIVLFGEGSLVLSVTNLRPALLEVELSAADIAYLPSDSMKASWQLDESGSVDIELSPDKQIHAFSVQVPTGEHYLRIEMAEHHLDQFLKIKVRDGGKDPAAGGGSIIVRKIEKPYHIATMREPIRVSIDGPTLLRVHELKEGREHVYYMPVSDSLRQVEIKPGEGDEERLVQIYRLVLMPDRPVVLPRTLTASQTIVPGPLVLAPPSPRPSRIRLVDAFSPGGQEDGTWSLTAGLASRRGLEEDLEGNLPPERFGEISLAHRFYNEYRRLYIQNELISRIREHGGPTSGIRGRLYLGPLRYPFTLKLEYSLYAQNPDAGQFDLFSGNREWAAFFKGTISRLQRVGPKLHNIVSLSMFARGLGMDSADKYEARDIDQDVFTQYKRDHRNGMIISDTVYYRPWLDTLLEAGASLTTNDDSQLLSVDHFSFRAGFKQLLGQMQANAVYRFTHYLDDMDRNKALNRNILSIELTRDFWMERQDRLQAGLKLDYSPDLNDVSASFMISWYFGKGRAFRDVLHDEMDFSEIKKRMVPQGFNNRVENEP